MRVEQTVRMRPSEPTGNVVFRRKCRLPSGEEKKAFGFRHKKLQSDGLKFVVEFCRQKQSCCITPHCYDKVGSVFSFLCSFGPFSESSGVKRSCVAARGAKRPSPGVQGGRRPPALRRRRYSLQVLALGQKNHAPLWKLGARSAPNF